MAKKLVAVTNIKANGVFTPAGETLDASGLDKKTLEDLYDAGAVRVVEIADEPAEKTDEEKPAEETKTETPTETATSAKAAPSAKSVAAQPTRETASGKGSSK